MKTIADPPKRDRWARLRFSVIGPLMAAPPEPGQLNGAFAALAAKTWRHPVTGLDVRFGASTLERWYYAARRAPDPVAALKDRLRGRRGKIPQPERGGHCSAEQPVPRASGLDGPVAPGQSARGLPDERLARGLVRHRAALPAGPGHASSGATQTSHRGRCAGPRPPGATGGPQLRSRACRGAVAPRLPPRLAQGAHPRWRLDQADVAGRHRRPFASGVSPAVVPRRDRAEPRARVVAGPS